MTRIIKVAMLHIEPRTADIDTNRTLISNALRKAAQAGVKWVLTPEMAVSGYFFEEVIGTKWISPQPDSWLKKILELCKSLDVGLFLSYPEKDPSSGKCYNCLFAVNRQGELVGKHCKIEVHPGTEEGWSSPGCRLSVFEMDGCKLGMLICADTYDGEHAKILAKHGAEIIIVAAAWGNKYPPEERWKKRSAETGLPLWVCNRTGKENQVDFTQARSVVVEDGCEKLVYLGETPAMLVYDFDTATKKTLSRSFTVIDMPLL
ncbi:MULTISPECIES: carbon-nitrogen hydrolase family protein [Dehalococcoides]|jgi:predicted amidohydrolase|uniref:carbon-nitrogen hydrolase family protein n=1 Tax=Dehalococcoides TaxID=61434 RepID=UPI0003C88106|nr:MULTISPECIES: carbon-nitrogen hydrolase family protein [Dehalococcoides]AHB13746.1 carbon-nitrogen hydrolase [Dehalococcoides mccartyi GY50]AII58127.1 carbon-nitrogen hydrolase [Dehalococcoides mccartyi CG1]APH12719.1 carbon-nitrogen hydrolase [Dehalococcoides mccartyi]QYY57862.1 carbon-nitrogen hydrolase family protein [Dehalococcoides mccartyi]BAQ34877.1 putative carbon-nitrogen hydrolase [Dehalococcoides sp. UCH007]